MEKRTTKDNSKKVRRIAVNVLFSLVAFSLFLIAVEVVLRTTHLFGATISVAEPCPMLYWRFTPGRKYWYKEENDHPIVGRINSHGWRDKEWSVRKAKDTYRIAVLGDSFIEARQVESDRTFMALTEQRMSEVYDRKVELMNFGLTGTTQTEQLLILKNDVGKFSPDMVLLFFLPLNDIRAVAKETSQRSRPFYHTSEQGELILDDSFNQMREFRVRRFINHFKQRSALISLLTGRYQAYKLARAARIKGTSAQGKEELSKYLSLCTNNPDATYEKNYRLNKTLIKAMSKYCKSKGIRFMLACIDTDAYISKNAKKYATIDSTFDANFFEDDLKSLAESIDIEYIGLQRVFHDSYERNQAALHWGHWNYEGHRVVADALSDELGSIFKSRVNASEEE